LVGGSGRSRKDGDDYIDLEPDKVGCELGETIGLALRRAVLDEQVVALHVAELAQTLAKGGETRRSVRSTIQDADSMYPPRRLRFGSEWRGQRAQCEPAQDCSPVHLLDYLFRPQQQRRRDGEAE
jgi:hypothetical protein